MSNTTKCILCGNGNFVDLPYFYRYRETLIRIVRCAACGLGTLQPMLSSDEVAALYQTGYFEDDYRCGTLAGSYTQEIETMRREFRPYLAMIRKLCPGGKYLEIGCAGGATLAEARENGFETVGVELSAEMAEWGTKNLQLDIRAGTLAQQSFPDDFFDVVYLGDVVEHLPEPRKVLAEIRRILKPRGIVAFAYPMELNYVVPRLRIRLQWQRQSPNQPYHLYYYTTQTLGRLLELGGFEVKVERVNKIIRRKPAWIYAVDLLNYFATKLTGAWGDRGFTIAQAINK